MKVKNIVSAALCMLMIFQLVSCGTLLYPERRNQKPGRIDPAVVLMDGIGLFFFILPGVIAFAVDLTTGAIYLPQSGGHPRKYVRAGPGLQPDRLEAVKWKGKRLTPNAISAFMKDRTGYDIDLADPRLIVIRAQPNVNIQRELSRMMVQNSRKHPDLGATSSQS